MDWQHPQALYLILPLCVAWLALALYSDRRRRQARELFVAQAMWSRILPTESRLRFWMKLALREVAIVTGLVALAGPRFGMQYEQVVPRGSDLYVLIDVSRSMLASDVPPSRLERAKLDVSALINRLEGERVGLIAFAGQAVVKCPLTVDYDSFRRALEELNPDSAPRGGTAIGDAIRKALEVFQAKADRDQAVLLITDGDDQQSYPLEAAAVAAERHVTIFTVGLGDAEKGARIPQKGDANNFVEYQGEQVWSKLNGNLLQEIALKTSGVYIPVSTRAYDLGELYVTHLQGKRGNDSASQQRIRRAEQFQWFLAIALAALLIDLCLSPYRRSELTSEARSRIRENSESRVDHPNSHEFGYKTSATFVLLTLSTFGSDSLAAEPRVSVRDGLSLYANEKYDAAREKFAAASKELDKQKSAAAAIAAFDEACAWHRQGELDKARDAYLRAGLSQDRSLATAAHFNLGTLAAEHARKLAGEQPEAIPVEKRQEILDQLKQAIVAYRHCLELQPEHSSSRRNLELVRQWIKHYSDKWREQDRQKRRDESNLIAFLEYLIQTQEALRETAKHLPATATADAFAELKRAQEELREEIPTLREKIAHDLRPQTPPGAATTPPQNSKEIEEGIALLQGWVDTAEQKMSAAASRLSARKPDMAVPQQQAAIDELDKIWDAVIPFHPLLAKDLADQTAIARTLNPAVSDDKQPETSSDEKTAAELPMLDLADEDLLKLSEAQERTLKRTRLLVPKAEAELQQLENAPAPPPKSPADKDEPNGDKAQATQVDLEQAKAGFRKAIELAPQAVEQQEAAVESLKKKDRPPAAQHAEAARKILEEIQQAQPKNNQQDQQKKDDDKSQDKNEDQKKDEPKPDDKKPDEKKSDEEKKDQQKKDDQKQQQKPQPQVSSDRLEDALRKVRERQQEKRERDRKLKAQIFGRAPVDKDW